MCRGQLSHFDSEIRCKVTTAPPAGSNFYNIGVILFWNCIFHQLSEESRMENHDKNINSADGKLFRMRCKEKQREALLCVLQKKRRIINFI